MRRSLKHLLLTATTLASLSAFASADSTMAGKPAIPDRMEPQTPQFKKDTAGVGIEEHRGDTIPLDLTFTDSTGHPAKLSQYFKKGRPVILQLGYFNCPQLCDVVSKGIMDGVKDLPLTLGTDYDMLYVSVNPTERWELGQKKKRTYVEEYGKPGAIEGWNFLVGRDLEIKALADAVGFKFRKVDGRDEFSHPPMIVVLTGDGTISRYFVGFQYPSETLKTGLVEAGQGKVGGYVEQMIISLCYHYDDYAGKYSLAYMRLMQIGGAFTVLLVGTWLGSRWIREARANRSQTLDASAPHSPQPQP